MIIAINDSYWSIKFNVAVLLFKLGQSQQQLFSANQSAALFASAQVLAKTNCINLSFSKM